MKLYITRHGQVDPNTEYFNGDVTLPRSEVLLSELGRAQAVMLGRHLKKLDFRGPIYASPLLRTMQTAELIAGETDSEIIPTPWIHEIFFKQEFIDGYKGYTMEELRQYFPHTSKSARMPDIWWAKKAETQDMVYARVSAGLKNYIKEGKEDALFVGHGASTGAAQDYLLWDCGMIWNCGLGMHDTEHPELDFGNDISYMPKEMVTNNKLTGAEMNFDPYCLRRPDKKY